MMMTANVVNLTMPVFVNDSCNSLIMMVVIIMKMFSSIWFQYVNWLLIGKSSFIILQLFGNTHLLPINGGSGRQRGGGSTKVLLMSLTTTNVEGQ
jgi:hypothetical protein